MKRKLITIVLSVAVTLALIPTMAAYADELDKEGTPPQVVEDVEDEQEPPEADMEEDEDIDEEDGEDVDQEESAEVELPKVNLKSPVNQYEQSEIGTQYTLIARVGEKVIDPALITWSSDNETVATISPEGLVTVMGVGKANFTAVMIDGTARNGYAKVFVFADKTKQDEATVDQSDNQPAGHKKHK